MHRIQGLWEYRPVRWLVLLLLLTGVGLYVASGYTGSMSIEKANHEHPTLINMQETIRAINDIEKRLKQHTDLALGNLNEIMNLNNDVQHDEETFIMVDPDSPDLKKFSFTTKSTLTMDERVMISKKLSDRHKTTSSYHRNRVKLTSRGSHTALSTTTPTPNLSFREPNNTEINNMQKVLSDPALVSLVPRVRVTDANCAKLFVSDPDEVKVAQQFQRTNQKVPIPDEEYSKLTKNCDQFKRDRQYILKPLSQEELEFPIAFSMVVFKDVEQVERLLRAIYRPQNHYCIHVDTKANEKVRQAISDLAACFDNVFLSSHSVDVQWGWFSVLEPELVCMEDLVKYKKWKYFINLTGQEWPLKTNGELVKILKTFNGANSMEGTVKRRNVERTQFIHNGFWSTNKRKETPPPAGITITKGSLHIAVSRAFVEYVLHDPLALEFRDWVKDTGVPDETFFTSLNHSPDLGVPGAYKGDPETDPVKYPFIARFKNWGTYPFSYPCQGQRVRMVCIWSVGDLPLLKTRPELFTNKFYLDYEPLALDCMEELHYNRTRAEVLGTNTFNTLYYQTLSFVKNHV